MFIHVTLVYPPKQKIFQKYIKGKDNTEMKFVI